VVSRFPPKKEGDETSLRRGVWRNVFSVHSKGKLGLCTPFDPIHGKREKASIFLGGRKLRSSLIATVFFRRNKRGGGEGWSSC